MQSQKRQNGLCSFPRQTIQYHGNPSLCPNQQCWRSWSWKALWGPIRPFRTNIQKRCPFHYRGLECKSRKSRNTWSNRQIWPWSTEWSRAKAIRVLPRECTGHNKQPLSTTKETTLQHGPHQIVNTEIKGIIFFAANYSKVLSSQQRQDQELTVAQIMSFFFFRSWTSYCQIQT